MRSATEGWSPSLLADAEEAVLRRLADLHQAVVEGIDRAPNLNALRTVMRQLFSRVILLHHDHPWLTDASIVRESSVEAAGHLLLPCLREGAVLGFDAMSVPTIRKAVLSLETAYDALQT